jgi:nucleoid-associated protein YgaU
MKVRRSNNRETPGYPSRRQFQNRRAILKAAAISLATVTSGCMTRTGGKMVSEPSPEMRSPGIVLAEPGPEFVTGGVIAPVLPDVPLSDGRYVVRAGDTLYGIAQRFLGQGTRWREIAKANPGLEPRALKAGQTISIPAAGSPR